MKRIPFALCLMLAAAVAGAEQLALSVLYFDNTSKNAEYEWLSKGLADMTATDLATCPGALVVEREQLEKVLKEQELGMSGLTDAKGAPALGKLLNAKVLVYGGFIVSGSSLRMDAKAVRAETGAVMAAAQVTRALSETLAAQRELSGKLAVALGLSFGASAGAPEKLEAAKAYYSGVSLLDQGKYSDALALFSQAQDMDPGFSKPGKSIEDAYKYLKDFKRQRYRREMNALKRSIDLQTARLSGSAFHSFADMAANPAKFGFKDAAAASAAYQAAPDAYNGDTPVQAIWYLQNLYSELGDLAVEYFEDEGLKRHCQDQMLRWAEAAEKAYPKDPFLPETLYQKIFVYRDRGQWQAVRDLCERLMGDFPDYRMMWAIEDFYESALEKLNPGSRDAP